MSDYINREAVKEEMFVAPLNGFEDGWNHALNSVYNNVPSADVRENIHGGWINAKVGRLFPSKDFKCSICGNILDFDGLNCGRGDANFCPNCGADMREGE